MSKNEYLIDSFDQRDPKHLPHDVLKGDYAFLLGAGASKPAGIDTNTDLINKWQDKIYDQEYTDKEKKKWVKNYEKRERKRGESQYGFWFEEAYDDEEARRNVIKKAVKGAQPTAGHVILASMMLNNTIPVTFTPNFDNLIEKTFYHYFDEYPQIINHPGVADSFGLRQNELSIVKLHGDYLVNNLQNTDEEREKLNENLGRIVKDTTMECGLIVVGYSGRDKSIMNALKNRVNKNNENMKIYWCILNRECEKYEYLDEILSKQSCELLEKTDSSIVKIDGFISLMLWFAKASDDINIPNEDNLIQKAKDRTNSLHNSISTTIADRILEPTGYENIYRLFNQLGLELSEDEEKRLLNKITEDVNNKMGNKIFMDIIEEIISKLFLNASKSMTNALSNGFPTKNQKDITLNEDIAKDTVKEVLYNYKNNDDVPNNYESYFNYLVSPINPEDIPSRTLVSEDKTTEEKIEYIKNEVFDDELESRLYEKFEIGKEAIDEIFDNIGNNDLNN